MFIGLFNSLMIPDRLPPVAPENSKPERNDTIETIKEMATHLNARDAVVEEVMPKIKALASKLVYISNNHPRVPNCLNALLLRNDDDQEFTKTVSDSLKCPTMAIYSTGSIDSAIKLCRGKNFDVIIHVDTFHTTNNICVSDKLMEAGICLPVVAISDGTLTQEVSIEECQNVYAVICYDTAKDYRALEVACQQVYIRFNVKQNIKKYAKELEELISSVERIQCKMET